MKNFDKRHLAFHVLVALYFIWIIVFGALMCMALVNAYGAANKNLTQLFTEWIFLNLIMGSALFVVIRRFRNRTVLYKVIVGSYIFMAIASIITVVLIGNTA